jgi:hypothetical protein
MLIAASLPAVLRAQSVCLVSVNQLLRSAATSTDWYAPCFYPNGDLEPKDMPCSSQGGACCPGRWQCLSNGLCYNEFRYERRTCTDQTWGASCPQVCDMQNGEHFFLPAVQAAEGEITLTPRPVVGGEQSRNGKSSHESETTQVYESNQAAPKEAHEAAKDIY